MTDNQQFDSSPSEESARESLPGQTSIKPEADTRPVGLAELIYGILFNPVATFRRISKEPPLFYAFLIFFAVVILISVTNTLVPSGIANSPELSAALGRSRPFIGIIGALFALIGWFIEAGLFQLLAEFFGGKGRAIGVLTVLALAEIPRVLVIPFQVIGYFAAGSLFGRFLSIAASIGVFLWWAGLLIIGLREIQDFSTGRSVATLLIPIGILGLTIFIFALAVVGLIVPFMGGTVPPS